jgi:alkylation response protein AidB-like acyl-CoA dehydrogenase
MRLAAPIEWSQAEMEILKYAAAHLTFREELREFCRQQVEPFIDQWEAAHQVPKSVWRKMGRAGFLCTAVEREYGGRQGDFLYSVIALEEVSRTNHYGLDAFLHSDIVVPYIASYGSDAQKKKYLPGCISGDYITAIAMTEPNAGSDLSSMAMTGVEDGEHVILNGTKTFISNGVICDLVIVAARDPAVQNPYQAISLYLVEDGTHGFAKGPPMEKLGVRSQDTNELYFNDCRIPAIQRLGEKGRGFEMLMCKLQQERLLVAVLAHAKAEFILDWTRRFFAESIGANGTSLPQAVQFAIAEVGTDVEIARTFRDKLIADHMEHLDITVATCMAKYWMTDLANRAADRCLDLVGEAALTEACPIVRTFRDVRVMPIFAGTNEIMKTIIAKKIGDPRVRA